MKKMKVRIKFIKEALGTMAADPELHEKFIASKSADKDKIKEELEAMPAEELMGNAVTCFPRDREGNPILWDYQIRGHLKSALGVKAEFEDIKFKRGKKEFKFSKWTYKRLVDELIFVFPREIKLSLPEGEEMGLVSRPLRADTMRGPRTALSTSESVPAETTAEFEIRIVIPELEPFVKEALDHGALNGLLQWRNAGYGSFEWEEIE